MKRDSIKDVKFDLVNSVFLVFLELFCGTQDCLMGILKEKTILYVTHQVEFLPAADLILVNRFSMIFSN